MFLLVLLLLLALNLQSTRSLDSLLHLEFAALLVFEKSVSFVFSLSNLLIKDLLLIVAQASKSLNLVVNHLLAHLKLELFLCFFTLSLLAIELLFLSCKTLNTFFLLKLFVFDQLLQTNLILVGFHDVFLHLSHLFLTLQFTDFLAFNVFFYLSFDKLAFKHFFF